MKIFVTTVLLATLAACARADIGITQAGYNYRVQQQQQQQQQQLQQNLPFAQLLQPQQLQQPAPFTQSYLPPVNQYHPQVPQQQLQQQQQQQHQHQSHRHVVGNVLPMPTGFPVNFQTAPNTLLQRRPRPRSRIPKKPIVTKNFFIHAAPEESEDEIQDELAQLAEQPRKHYNVLFVKTPAQTNRVAALNLAKNLKQEKTVVYVLAKKTSASDLQDAIGEAPQHITKPEVFFIKYRTPEEAVSAQRQIQTQYDALGGSSTITDEGVAPITSVVGSLDAPEEDDEEVQQQQQQGQSEQQTQYQQDEQSLDGNLNNQYLPTNQF